MEVKTNGTKRALRQRKKTALRKENHLCIDCGKPAVTKTLCEAHRQRANKYSSGWRNENAVLMFLMNHAWRERQLEKGLCRECKEKAVTRLHCEKHRQMNNERVNEYLARKKRS
jgi:hypothetical protein